MPRRSGGDQGDQKFDNDRKGKASRHEEPEPEVPDDEVEDADNSRAPFLRSLETVDPFVHSVLSRNPTVTEL